MQTSRDLRMNKQNVAPRTALSARRRTLGNRAEFRQQFVFGRRPSEYRQQTADQIHREHSDMTFVSENPRRQLEAAVLAGSQDGLQAEDVGHHPVPRVLLERTNTDEDRGREAVVRLHVVCG
jgi:hypothetical protein